MERRRFNMRNLIRTFLAGVVSVLGMLTGFAVFEKLSNPVERKKIKNKLTNIKNAIMKKD
jgi:hypothetical protein